MQKRRKKDRTEEEASEEGKNMKFLNKWCLSKSCLWPNCSDEKLIITGLELGNRRSRKMGHEHICATNARLLTQEAACQWCYRCFLSAEQRYKQSSDLCDSQLLGPSRFSEHMCPHCSSSSCQRLGVPHSSFPSTISSRYEAARAQGCC
uniref:Uncharacterized protein n=1 Tax=Rousettus aegyptiacus TaxID=9407 RepID=A0A7J8CIQ3_ROUAE|nr:hypothetical protein HJG63_009181 [Rousettus aegyptiacus]